MINPVPAYNNSFNPTALSVSLINLVYCNALAWYRTGGGLIRTLDSMPDMAIEDVVYTHIGQPSTLI